MNLNDARRMAMISMRREGNTLREIAEEFGISRQRVQQMIGNEGYTKKGKKIDPETRKQIRLEKRISLFWSSVDKKSDNDCWNWTRGRSSQLGYGSFKLGNEQYTHRLAWELTNGKIPEGLCVCHHCDNPLCCNPNHLFLGTVKDNMQDRDMKGRGRFSKQRANEHG